MKNYLLFLFRNLTSTALLVLFSSNLYAAENQISLADYLKERLVSRADWKARDANADTSKWRGEWDTFSIHHSAGSGISSNQVVKNIQFDHMMINGWSDTGLHYFVGQDGKVYEGRSMDYQGAHIKGHNDHTVGIMALGCFDETECDGYEYDKAIKPTDKMIDSMAALIGFLAFQRGDAVQVNSDTVRSHKELSATHTASPGNLIINRLESITAKAARVFAKLKKLNHKEL